MKYRRFGRTGLFVSELCLGTMTFGGKGFWEAIGKLTATEAQALVGTALDGGINFIDTANAYAEGESEKFLGAALAALGRPREEVSVATKVRLRTGPGPNQVGLSRAHSFAAVEASLRRLQLDFIDLYQIHGVDGETPIEETIVALNDLVRAGKVRYVGFCNLPAWGAMKALAFADAHGLARFVSAQMFYAISSRDIERELVPLAEDQGLAILPWSPLAGGLLSGKFDLDKPGPAGARRTTFDFPPVDRARTIKVLAVLRKVAAAQGISVARVALAWLLTRSFVTSVIIGAKTREQLQDNLEASDVRLTPEQITELDAASALPPEYPGWMVAWQNRDRAPPPPPAAS
ncbi:MAG: aldo/keto reductase [Kiritimatiellaeota bacterium]|nr:aldo/keto reductase [Kiritimatiellota bacterium]